MQTSESNHQLGIVKHTQSGEMATSAMAAKSKALVEARYIIAYSRPRNIDQARIDLLAACKRKAFAESARYRKPVGGQNTVDGFSIRFAEEAIKAMKNISVDSSTIYEDSERRTVQISVTDLESNLTYGKEVTVNKTVERRNLKAGQQVLSQRLNSTGQMVYLVEASEDEIANKIASAESKIIRNCGLRLVPSDILEEAEQAIEETLAGSGIDVKASVKKVTDAFATIGVNPTELEKYIKHSLSTVSPKEISDLRAVYSAIKDGEASWADYIGEAEKKAGKPPLESKPEPVKEAAVSDPDDGGLGPVSASESPKSEPPEQESYQSKIAAFMSEGKVVWGDFKDWAVGSGRLKAEEAKSINSYSELSDAFCKALSRDTVSLAKCVKTYGGKE